MFRRCLMGFVGVVAASAMVFGDASTAMAWHGRGCGCGYAQNTCGSRWGGGFGWRHRRGCCNTNYYTANTCATGCSTGACSTGGCSTGACSVNGCSANVTYTPNGAVYTYTSGATTTTNGVQTYTTQPMTAPQPYTTGYQPQAVDANGNAINQPANVEVNTNNRIDQNPNLAPQENSNASGKIDLQPNSNDGINQTTNSGNAVPEAAPAAPAPEIK